MTSRSEACEVPNLAPDRLQVHPVPNKLQPPCLPLPNGTKRRYSAIIEQYGLVTELQDVIGNITAQFAVFGVDKVTLFR